MNERSSDNTCKPVELLHASDFILLRYSRIAASEENWTRLSSCVLRDGPLWQYLCYCIWNNTNVWGLATNYKLTKPMKASSRNNFSEPLPISAGSFRFIRRKSSMGSNLHFSNEHLPRIRHLRRWLMRFWRMYDEELESGQYSILPTWT